MAPQAELKRYPDSASACLVKSKLAQEGIPATVHRASRYAGMGGAGYVLRVDAENLERARGILEPFETEIDMDEYVDAGDTSYRRCPECRSVMVTRAPLTRAQRTVAIVTLGVGYTLVEKDFTCAKCGARWRGR